MTNESLPANDQQLVQDIRQLITDSRQAISQTVNIGLTRLYWQVGKRINEEILLNQRAEYGRQIVATLSHQLKIDYGHGFDEKSLRRMIQFAETFPEADIVATLSRQLTWSHFRELIPLVNT